MFSFYFMFGLPLPTDGVITILRLSDNSGACPDLRLFLDFLRTFTSTSFNRALPFSPSSCVASSFSPMIMPEVEETVAGCDKGLFGEDDEEELLDEDETDEELLDEEEDDEELLEDEDDEELLDDEDTEELLEDDEDDEELLEDEEDGSISFWVKTLCVSSLSLASFISLCSFATTSLQGKLSISSSPMLLLF